MPGSKSAVACLSRAGQSKKSGRVRLVAALAMPWVS